MHRNKIIAAVCAAFMALSFPSSSQAWPVFGPNIVTISGDRGGQIISYAVRAKGYERSGKKVRFSGRCDSACTLFLSLPPSQTCVTSGAKFGFHLPYGSSAEGNRTAAKFLMGKYPGWVRGWIAANGGLSRSLKTMPASYAARYLATC